MEKNYLFSASHEWARVEGKVAWVGISTYAAKKLGEVVFVDLPSVGDTFQQAEEFGAIESVKAASELYAPVSGVVVEINEALIDQPELINQNASEAWLIKLEMANQEELANLLNYEDYLKTCK
jgi:glycine cleavage system H protein